MPSIQAPRSWLAALLSIGTNAVAANPCETCANTSTAEVVRDCHRVARDPTRMRLYGDWIAPVSARNEAKQSCDSSDVQHDLSPWNLLCIRSKPPVARRTNLDETSWRGGRRACHDARFAFRLRPTIAFASVPPWEAGVWDWSLTPRCITGERFECSRCSYEQIEGRQT